MSHLAIVANDGSKKITKFERCGSLAAAQAHVAQHGGFACAEPVGFQVRTWKVNADNTDVVVDQNVVDADAALAQAIEDEASRVATFVDHGDLQAILNQLKSATAPQVISTLTADLTGAATLGQVKAVVGTYLAKIILVEAYLVRKL
jgi:hypothetical protein